MDSTRAPSFLNSWRSGSKVFIAFLEPSTSPEKQPCRPQTLPSQAVKCSSLYLHIIEAKLQNSIVTLRSERFLCELLRQLRLSIPFQSFRDAPYDRKHVAIFAAPFSPLSKVFG